MTQNILQFESEPLPHHLKEWEKSGISPEIIGLNFRSVTDSRTIKALLNWKTAKGWTGSKGNHKGWTVWGINPLDSQSVHFGCQVKLDSPRVTDEKTIKYETPSGKGEAVEPLLLRTSQENYWQDVLSKNEPVIITEGAKKAGCLISLGYAAISIPGVTNAQYQGAINPHLKPFCGVGRKVLLAYDSDFHDNPKVRRELDRLGRLIAAEGAVPLVVLWDKLHKGIDDLVVNCGGESAHRAIDQAVTFEKWRKSVKSDDVASQSEAEKPKSVKRQTFEALKERYSQRLRLNIMSKQVELDGKQIKPDYLYLELLEEGYDCSKEMASDAFYFFATQNQYHPVRQYLDSVHKQHGQTGVLDNASAKYLGTTNPIYDVFVRKFAISAVARVFSPGCKVDTALILQGKQGARKSTFYSVLAGPWFDDSLSNATTDKDEKLKLHGTWLMEWAELESIFNRKDVSSVKSFMSSATDKLRPPFARTTENYPRHSVICGSTNTDDFLLDSTGNRRFWVLPVAKIDIDALVHDRDRFWADAVHLYKSGAQWWLTDKEQQESQQINQDYQRDDTWTDPIKAYCESLDKVTIKAILEHLGIELSKQDRQSQIRVADILRQLGYVKKHSRAGKYWVTEGHRVTDGTTSGLQRDPSSDLSLNFESMGHTVDCDPVNGDLSSDSNRVTPETVTQQGLKGDVTHVTHNFDQNQEKKFAVGEAVKYIGKNHQTARYWQHGKPAIEAIHGSLATVSKGYGLKIQVKLTELSKA